MAPKAGNVWVRIRRMGSQWATCGMGVRPPEKLVGKPGMKRLCPKLVPGQVIELPQNHPLTKQHKLIEFVNGLESDEFLRPWVFPTQEAAMMANPTKSRMGADDIAAGLALVSGAQRERKGKLDERLAEQPLSADQMSPADAADAYDDELRKQLAEAGLAAEPLETDDELAARTQNRELADIRENARPVEDDEGEQSADEGESMTSGGRRGGRRTGAGYRR